MISVIIPTYNEEQNIGRLVDYLMATADPRLLREVIVVDGGSTDRTAALAEAAGARVLFSPVKGRAAQMNFGAREASGRVLYFLHADTYPPENFCLDIRKAIDQQMYFGGYRLRFDSSHWFLRLNAWFTRFDVSLFRFGDQSLFVEKGLFEEVGGFREELSLLEDQEIIFRLRRKARFKLVPRNVITSARKYREYGVFRTQFYFYLLYALYRLGLPQRFLVGIYKSLFKP
ncbi:TIGR04283 family arsenosugar biosynthesis glycosyltransferase [soil metagenome]